MPFNESILLVDDEKDIRDTLSEILTLKGYNTITCSDGTKAIEKLKDSNTRIGIVITDINMPVMSGLELLKVLREIDDTIITIIITAYATREAAIEALKHGAYDFIKKPFNIVELTLILKRAIEKRNLILENMKYQRDLENMVKIRTQQIEELNRFLGDLNKLGISNRKDIKLNSKLLNIHSFINMNFKADSYALIVHDGNSEKYDTFQHTFNKDEQTALTDSHYREMIDLIFSNHTASSLLINKNDPNFKHYQLFYGDNSVYIFPFHKNIYSGCVYLGFSSMVPKLEIDAMIKPLIRELESALENNYLIEKHNDELRRMFLSSVQTHAHTIEAKDPYTKGHCNRVEIYSKMIAEDCKMSEDDLFELKIACILHDIGKIGVSESILSKPSKLTDEEFNQMKLHPVIGGEIVKDLYGFNIAPVIKHHHERFDGRGYPEGLSGTAIPLGARIIAVADTFDAMTSDRPYRKGLSKDIAINELKIFKNKQFDPDIVDIFLKDIKKLEKVYTKLMNMKFNQLSSLSDYTSSQLEKDLT